LLTRARNQGKKVFFDIDDLIFDPDFTHLIVAGPARFAKDRGKLGTIGLLLLAASEPPFSCATA